MLSGLGLLRRRAALTHMATISKPTMTSVRRPAMDDGHNLRQRRGRWLMSLSFVCLLLLEDLITH